MKKRHALGLALLALQLSGCAGLFVAGAATTVNLVTDPRSSGEVLSDQEISLNATALGNKPPLQSHVRISTSTYRGKVLLMGQAETDAYRQQVSNQVRQIDGVKTIYNQMRVRPLLSVGEISKDVWITTKVKSALLADQKLREVKVSVYTEDGEVFLVGAVTPAQEDIAVEIARNISGVKQVIKAFYQLEPAQQAAKPAASTTPAPVTNINTGAQAAPQPAPASNSEVIPFRQPVEDAPLTEESL
jgi:osmotically-inducible protein OsmY